MRFPFSRSWEKGLGDEGYKDHLGSTSLVYDGTSTVRQGYMPWGEQRFVDGAGELPTTFRYTGQREEEGIGLYFYGARWYDDALGRWIQPDTIVPATREDFIAGVVEYDRRMAITPLTVDFHEQEFLYALNGENAQTIGGEELDLLLVPHNPQSFDRYAYVMNNALRYTDPSGHCLWDLCIIEIGIVSLGLVELGGIALAVGLVGCPRNMYHLE